MAEIETRREVMTAVKVVSVFLILGLGIFVALSPGLVYAPTPKIVLFFLISFLLQAFINQVNGLIKRGSLTVEQGQTLIHDVNEVMNHVGG